jgi:nucleotide-binding universal stress UspA family protein
VCLLHAFPHVADHLGFPTYDHMLETATMHGRELLDTFYNKLHPLVPLETQLIEGPPAAAILRVAQAEGFDLIIVGSRGNNSLVSLLMGSVSTSVTQRAPCPVMVTH